MAVDAVRRVRGEIEGLGPDVRAVLDRHGFDVERFLELVARWQGGGLRPASCRVTGQVTTFPDELVEDIPEPGTAPWVEARERGLELIRSGRAGALILNGGMGTRFGGVVKGVVEALPGRSFLELKLRQLESLPARVPAFLMNSFATVEATAEHLVGVRPSVPVHCFTQGIAVRLTADGHVFRDPAHPLAALYAPGHGDTGAAFRAAGLLGRFRDSGGEWLVVSNVDNVGASVDPVVLGLLARSGKRLAVELAERRAGDTGGMAAVVDGVPQILEHFRFPAGFDHSRIRRFNTNTLVVHAGVFERDHPLTWFAVEKTAGGVAVVQFERLIGELTAFEPTLFLGVPRSGPRSRFLPVKTPADLAGARAAIEEIVSGWGGPAGI